jgi:hypothetical protein
MDINLQDYGNPSLLFSSSRTTYMRNKCTFDVLFLLYQHAGTKQRNQSERELEILLVIRCRARVRAAVRRPAGRGPAPALLHEPLQRRLPRHRQVGGRGSSPRRGGGEAQQARRLFRGDAVEHQHLVAVHDGHLRGSRFGAGIPGVDVGARHERERPPHGHGRRRLRPFGFGRLHVVAERATRRREPAGRRRPRAARAS